MPDFMSVAFSSERSIEDELERESEAEVITVVISYAVMLVYIAVALGQFRSWKTLLVSRPCQSDRLAPTSGHFLNLMFLFDTLMKTNRRSKGTNS